MPPICCCRSRSGYSTGTDAPLADLAIRPIPVTEDRLSHREPIEPVLSVRRQSHVLVDAAPSPWGPSARMRISRGIMAAYRAPFPDFSRLSFRTNRMGARNSFFERVFFGERGHPSAANAPASVPLELGRSSGLVPPRLQSYTAAKLTELRRDDRGGRCLAGKTESQNACFHQGRSQMPPFASQLTQTRWNVLLGGRDGGHPWRFAAFLSSLLAAFFLLALGLAGTASAAGLSGMSAALLPTNSAAAKPPVIRVAACPVQLQKLGLCPPKKPSQGAGAAGQSNRTPSAKNPGKAGKTTRPSTLLGKKPPRRPGTTNGNTTTSPSGGRRVVCINGVRIGSR